MLGLVLKILDEAKYPGEQGQSSMCIHADFGQVITVRCMYQIRRGLQKPETLNLDPAIVTVLTIVESRATELPVVSSAAGRLAMMGLCCSSAAMRAMWRLAVFGLEQVCNNSVSRNCWCVMFMHRLEHGNITWSHNS